MELYNILKEIFELDEEAAQKASGKHSLDEFEINFKRLEAIVGFEVAVAAVKFGSLLEYENSYLEKYFGMVKNARVKLSGRYGSQGTQPIIDNRAAFYSVETLKEFLEGDKEKETRVSYNISDIAHMNRLLHKNNEN